MQRAAMDACAAKDMVTATALWAALGDDGADVDDMDEATSEFEEDGDEEYAGVDVQSCYG